MILPQTQTSFYETVGVFNTIDSIIFADDSYTNFCIQKILENMKTLDQSILEIQNISVEQAKIELAFLKSLQPELKKVKKIVKNIDASNKMVFKTVAMDFFKTVKKFKYEMEEVVIDHNMGTSMMRDRANRKADDYSTISNEEFRKSLKEKINALQPN